MSVTAKQRLNELEEILRAEKDQDDTVRANLYDKFEYISNTVKWSSLRNLNPKDDQQIDEKSKLTNQQLIDMV